MMKLLVRDPGSFFYYYHSYLERTVAATVFFFSVSEPMNSRNAAKDFTLISVHMYFYTL